MAKKHKVAMGPLTEVALYIGFDDEIWYEAKVTVRRRETDPKTFDAAMDSLHRKLRADGVSYTFLCPSEILD